jgi:hypothetical protein
MYNPDDPATPAQDHATPCALCGHTRSDHGQMEAVGSVHHRWAADSQSAMTAVETDTSGNKPVPQTQVIIAPAPDIILRQALRDMGVITDEQYKRLFR